MHKHSRDIQLILEDLEIPAETVGPGLNGLRSAQRVTPSALIVDLVRPQAQEREALPRYNNSLAMSSNMGSDSSRTSGSTSSEVRICSCSMANHPNKLSTYRCTYMHAAATACKPSKEILESRSMLTVENVLQTDEDVARVPER